MAETSRVFVVDQDESARNGLTRLLRKAGYDAHGASAISDFLDAYDPEITTCLVLDATTSDLPGETLQAELEARVDQLRVIMVTADDDPSARGCAQRMHATCLFRKPVDGSALRDAVDWALRHQGGAGAAS